MAKTWAHPGFPFHWEDSNAREAIGKALAIDPALGEAHMVLGRIEFFDWNWAAAEREYKLAIELNPNLADAHSLYSEYLNFTSHIDECMKEAERAKALDPSNDRIAWAFYSQRQYDRFIESKRNDIASHMFGPMAHFDLGYGYERAGMHKEAVNEWEQAMTGFGYDDLAADLRRGYAAGGFTAAMREWVAGWELLSKQNEPVDPDTPAYIYSILGEKDRAFAWLNKSFQQRSTGLPFLKIDPTWDDIRSDPRFADLVRRLGLPQ